MQPDEPGVRSIQRILGRSLQHAVELLASGRLTDRRVHAARKELKKARAILRLLRDSIGAPAYRRENAALRDCSRSLSAMRDAQALLDSLDALREFANARGRSRIHELRRLLDARAKLSPVVAPPNLAHVRAALRQCQQHCARWNMHDADWAPIGKGLWRTYRNGRGAYAAARADGNDEQLHEWRKQASYLWRQLGLLEPLRSRFIHKLAQRTHALCDLLGDDHDLVVLRGRLVSENYGLAGNPVDDLSDAIDRRRARLQRKAFALGREIFASRPREIKKRIRRRWSKWRKYRVITS